MTATTQHRKTGNPSASSPRFASAAGVKNPVKRAAKSRDVPLGQLYDEVDRAFRNWLARRQLSPDSGTIWFGGFNHGSGIR